MTRPVIVGTYLYPHEAYIARASLESAGIPVVLADEHTINTDWLYSNALGGVKLLVDAERESIARAILAADYSAAVDEECGVEAPRCSACGSLACTPHTTGKRSAFVMIVLLGFPLLFFRHGLKCDDCGEFWEE
jgi:hypothetical protein